MPGIVGMGTPNKQMDNPPEIQPPPLDAPEMDPQAALHLSQQLQPTQQAPAAPQQADSFDYDKWAQEQIAAPQAQSSAPTAAQGNFDYDAWAKQQLHGEEESTFHKILSGTGAVLQKAATAIDHFGPAQLRTGLSKLTDYADGKPSDPGQSMLTGVNAPSFSQVFDKLIPHTKITAPEGFVMGSDPGAALFGNTDTGVDKALKNPAKDTGYTTNDALGFIADFLTPGAVINGAKGVAKVGGLGSSLIKDSIEASRLANLANAEASVAGPTVKATTAIDGITKTADEASKISQGVKMTPAQLNLTDAHEQAIGRSLANNAQVIAFQQTQGQAIADGIKKSAEAFANLTPKAGGAEKVFDTIVGAADAEGKILGKFRTAANTAAGNGKLPITAIESKLAETMQKIGIVDDAKTGTYTFPKKVDGSPDFKTMAIQGNMSTGEAEELFDRLSTWKDRISQNGGKMTYNDIQNLYQQDFTKAAKRVEKMTNASPEFKSSFYDMRSAGGEDLRNLTGTILKDGTPTVATEYADANNRFAEIKKAYGEIPKVLNRGDMSADSLVKYISSGDASMDHVDAFNKILGNTNPELRRDLNGALVNKLFFENAKVADTGTPLFKEGQTAYDFGGIKKDLKKIAGSDGVRLDKITGSPENTKNMMDFVDHAEKLQMGAVKAQPAINEGILSRTLYLASKVGAPKEFVQDAIMMVNRDQYIEKYMKAVGAEALSKTAPPSMRPQLTYYIGELLKERDTPKKPQGQ
jgi:hypothetical protein